MIVLGLDVGRAVAVCAALNYFPVNPQQYFRQHRREFFKIRADRDGVEKLLSFAPDAIVLEPTGSWYSSFWGLVAKQNDIKVFWIAHTQLAHQRGAYGFVNKRDDEDAFCLALTYFDPNFVDIHGQKRYLKTYDNESIEAIRKTWLEIEQLDKLRTAAVNQLRQRLSLEFPEIAARQWQISEKLGFSPALGWLAGIHSYTKIVNDYQGSIAPFLGIAISDYTREHALLLVSLEQRIHQKELDLRTRLRGFDRYLEVFRRFGFGLKSQALLLLQIYPFERFLFEGQPWIVYEPNRVGKRVKRNRSERQFQSYLGLGYQLAQSGGNLSRSYLGSSNCRAHLYAWALTTVAPKNRDKKPPLVRELGAKFDDWRQNKRISGKDSLIRVLFTTSRWLFRELSREFCEKIPTHSL
jgi:hypothetical protein